jgi:signal transduction histidine kinase
LTRLNHSLLLLAKIENRQFEDVQKIDMKKRVQDKMTDFQELWQSHGLIVNASLGEVFVKMNEELADLLLNNLLSNATMHNFKGGRITIDLNQDHLLVSNTSNHVVLDKEKMFQRFYKPNQTKEQNGLGLSIIRQISDASGFVVKYALASDMHNFMIGWNASITFSNLEEGLT